MTATEFIWHSRGHRNPMLAEKDRLRPGGSVARKWPQKRASHDAKSHKVLGQALWKMADSASLGDRRHYVDGVSAGRIYRTCRPVDRVLSGRDDACFSVPGSTATVAKPAGHRRCSRAGVGKFSRFGRLGETAR